MSNKPKIIPENKKVFFITSSYSNLFKNLKFTMRTNKAMNGLKAGEESEYITDRIFSNDRYTITICSFEINPSELNDNLKDKETKQFLSKIHLKQKKGYYSYTFEGLINFRKKNKNTFIYDFKFNDIISSWTKQRTNPPPFILFSKFDQFKLYSEFLLSKKIKTRDEIYIDLIQDSQIAGYKDKFPLDFFLEIFKRCYSQKEVKLLLVGFKLEKSYIPENFKISEYSKILDLVKKNPKILTQHCGGDEDTFRFYIKFYTLLFYIWSNFEKEKANQLISDKNLYIYFANFLPRYPEYFQSLICSEELIDEMFVVTQEKLEGKKEEEKKIIIDLIKGIFNYAGSVGKILFFMNKNAAFIRKCSIQLNKKLIMSTLGNAQEGDDLKYIYEEICKLIDFEKKEHRVIFVSFDDQFWESYITLNNDLFNLELINKSINKCAELENFLSAEKLGLYGIYHNRGIQLIYAGELKNEEILDFISLDFYFSERYKDYKSYKDVRPYSTIIKGLNFETMTEAFYERWHKLNLFRIFNFDKNNFKKCLIEKVTEIKDFGKLLKLFDYKNPDIFDSVNTRMSLEIKFQKIFSSTFKYETCPNYKEDIAYYIYIMDFVDKRNIQNFLKNTIEKTIDTVEIIRNIYLHLARNYKDISNNAIDCITNFLTSSKTNNKSQLNSETILFLLEKIENKHIIKSLMNKLEYFLIKEDELFNPRNDFESFKLLYGIQQKNLLNTCQYIRETKYLIKIIEIGEKILNNIKLGEIKYSSFNKVWKERETKGNKVENNRQR